MFFRVTSSQINDTFPQLMGTIFETYTKAGAILKAYLLIGDDALKSKTTEWPSSYDQFVNMNNLGLTSSDVIITQDFTRYKIDQSVGRYLSEKRSADLEEFFEIEERSTDEYQYWYSKHEYNPSGTYIKAKTEAGAFAMMALTLDKNEEMRKIIAFELHAFHTSDYLFSSRQLTVV